MRIQFAAAQPLEQLQFGYYKGKPKPQKKAAHNLGKEEVKGGSNSGGNPNIPSKVNKLLKKYEKEDKAAGGNPTSTFASNVWNA